MKWFNVHQNLSLHIFIMINSLKCLVWNICGVLRLYSLRYLQSLIHVNRVVLLILIEPFVLVVQIVNFKF